MAILKSTEVLLRARDVYMQGLAAFVLVMIVQEVIFGYLDLQWTDYRNLVTMGVLFALVSRVGRLAAQAETPDIFIVRSNQVA